MLSPTSDAGLIIGPLSQSSILNMKLAMMSSTFSNITFSLISISPSYLAAMNEIFPFTAVRTYSKLSAFSSSLIKAV